MKLVVTLLTRDQADTVDAVVAYHLYAGADLVIATDHRSEDGTTEILESYERDGVLRLIRERGEELRTQEWRTRMAQLAADLGADWVIGCDGDEFWWPRAGTLKQALSAVPPRFGVVEGGWRFFLPRPEGPSFFAERMIVRLSPFGPLVHPLAAFKPRVKIAHRAHPAVVVQGGNHRLLTGELEPLRGWHPFEVFHFPSRSREQSERRYRGWKEADRPLRFARASITGPVDAYDSETIDDELLTAGLEVGALALDTRLRDVLRQIAVSDRERDVPGRRFALLDRTNGIVKWAEPPVDDVGVYANEMTSLSQTVLVQLARRVDELSARASAVERGPAGRTVSLG